MKKRAFLILSLSAPLFGGCITHAVHVEPITLAPIHMTVDVNVHADSASVTETSGGAVDPEAPAQGTTPRD